MVMSIGSKKNFGLLKFFSGYAAGCRDGESSITSNTVGIFHKNTSKLNKFSKEIGILTSKPHPGYAPGYNP